MFLNTDALGANTDALCASTVLKKNPRCKEEDLKQKGRGEEKEKGRKKPFNFAKLSGVLFEPLREKKSGYATVTFGYNHSYFALAGLHIRGAGPDPRFGTGGYSHSDIYVSVLSNLLQDSPSIDGL